MQNKYAENAPSCLSRIGRSDMQKNRDLGRRDLHFFAQIRYKGRRFKTAGPCGSLILRCLPETTLAGMEIGAVRNTITRLAE